MSSKIHYSWSLWNYINVFFFVQVIFYFDRKGKMELQTISTYNLFIMREKKMSTKYIRSLGYVCIKNTYLLWVLIFNPNWKKWLRKPTFGCHFGRCGLAHWDPTIFLKVFVLSHEIISFLFKISFNFKLQMLGGYLAHSTMDCANWENNAE